VGNEPPGYERGHLFIDSSVVPDIVFSDRADAGRQLADRLRTAGVTGDIVLAIPRGGLPVGRAVADALGLPLDIVVASKVGAPHNPELAIGAATADGTLWRNDDLIGQIDVETDYIERERQREADAAREKVEQYRADSEPPDLAGKTVLVVDDGVATGATARACCQQVANEAARVVLAVPVGPPDTIADLEADAAIDAVVCVETPSAFGAVGRYYTDFSQVSDAEAMTYLE
jgi:predicted phosphoribosyltransferase